MGSARSYGDRDGDRDGVRPDRRDASGAPVRGPRRLDPIEQRVQAVLRSRGARVEGELQPAPAPDRTEPGERAASSRPPTVQRQGDEVGSGDGGVSRSGSTRSAASDRDPATAEGATEVAAEGAGELGGDAAVETSLSSVRSDLADVDRVLPDLPAKQVAGVAKIRTQLAALEADLEEAKRSGGRLPEGVTNSYARWRAQEKGMVGPWGNLRKAVDKLDRVPRPQSRTRWSATCDAVWQDMNSRFTAWDGSLARRGHWYQGPPHGGPNGAVKVGQEVLSELRSRNASEGARWSLAPSTSTGRLAFHRKRKGVAFIFHLDPSVES